jgi:hypothetical protein
VGQMQQQQQPTLIWQQQKQKHQQNEAPSHRLLVGCCSFVGSVVLRKCCTRLYIVGWQLLVTC